MQGEPWPLFVVGWLFLDRSRSVPHNVRHQECRVVCESRRHMLNNYGETKYTGVKWTRRWSWPTVEFPNEAPSPHPTLHPSPTPSMTCRQDLTDVGDKPISTRQDHHQIDSLGLSELLANGDWQWWKHMHGSSVTRVHGILIDERVD